MFQFRIKLLEAIEIDDYDQLSLARLIAKNIIKITRFNLGTCFCKLKMINSELNKNINNFQDLNIIDVTLRDGAHQVNFKWPLDYTKNHISVISKSKTINFIELVIETNSEIM